MLLKANNILKTKTLKKNNVMFMKKDVNLFYWWLTVVNDSYHKWMHKLCAKLNKIIKCKKIQQNRFV